MPLQIRPDRVKDEHYKHTRPSSSTSNQNDLIAMPSEKPPSTRQRSQQLQAPAPWVPGASGLKSTPGRGLDRRFRAPACSRGSFRAMAVNRSRTFSEVFAEVSKNRSPASLAYASASAALTARLSGFSVTKSSLFPARAMMMFSFACLCSSLTQALALSRDDWSLVRDRKQPIVSGKEAYSLGDIVNDNGTVCIPVVHGRKRFVPLLTRRVPYLELHGGTVVEGYSLCEERSSYGRLPVIIKLVLLYS